MEVKEDYVELKIKKERKYKTANKEHIEVLLFTPGVEKYTKKIDPAKTMMNDINKITKGEVLVESPLNSGSYIEKRFFYEPSPFLAMLRKK